MSAMGWCANYLRMPLTPMEDAHKEKLFALMKAEGLL
jgi:4-hydroxy-tetrahydrodipicolinate synthase